MLARDLKIGERFRFHNRGRWNYTVVNGQLTCLGVGNDEWVPHVMMRVDLGGRACNGLPYVVMEPVESRGYITWMGREAVVELV